MIFRRFYKQYGLGSCRTETQTAVSINRGHIGPLNFGNSQTALQIPDTESWKAVIGIILYGAS